MAKVMLVDDDRTTIKLLQTLLELDGFEVSTAVSGSASFQVAETFQPDVVLLDYHLTDMTGTDVVQHLRTNGFEDLPIIITSGLDVSEQVLRAGANRFLLKPFEPDELPHLLRELIG
jgi:CheY-like chemotaxis protein